MVIPDSSSAEPAEALLTADGPVARAFAARGRAPGGFEARPQQIDMARRVGAALSSGRHALLEAGTGVGKSFAYLVPALCWAAGFLAHDGSGPPEDAHWPAVLLEYGTHDELFPFDQVAVPMREHLEGMGIPVHFRVDRGGRHWPSGDFQPEALDWFFSEAWRSRS